MKQTDDLIENEELDPANEDNYDLELSEIKIGSKLRKDKIVTFIHARNEDFVIYNTNVGEDPEWSWTCNDSAVNDGLHKLNLLCLAADQKFRGIPFIGRANFIIEILRVIFNSRDEQKISLALKHFEEQINARPAPKHVIAKSSKFVVWITKNGNVSYSCRNLKNVNESIGEYNRLKALANAMLTKEELDIFNRRLGAALANAFRAQPGTEIEKYFFNLENLIHKTAENKIKIKYIVTTITAAAILATLFFTLYFTKALSESLSALAVAACGGFIGTFLSISERSKQITTSEYNSTGLIILLGILRVCLGGLFGTIAYLAAASGFAFTLLSDSNTKLALLGIAAGFSERLIPDLISGISPQKQNYETPENS